MRTPVHALLAAASTAALVAGGCNCGAPDGVVDHCNAELALPPSVSTDILFVIDNSRSLREEQAKVVAQLQTFVQKLKEAPVKNDWQIGVVTTTVTEAAKDCNGNVLQVRQFPEQRGALQFGKNLDGTVASTTTGKILKSDDPELLTKFQVLVGQGIERGSGQEMGLQAMRLALSEPLLSTPVDGTPPGNQGLLRPGSRLLVVIVTDEDDCSPPTESSVTLRPPCPSDPVCNLDTDPQCASTGAYCVFATSSSANRTCQVNNCETPEGRAALEPVANFVQFLKDLDDGTGTGRKRDTLLAVIGPVDASGNPARCKSTGDEAYGIGVRYKDAVTGMGEKGLIESICSDNYAAALARIGDLVNASHTIEIDRAPPDGHLLQILITRQNVAEPIVCKMGEGFDFEPATDLAKARVTLKGNCRLQNLDKLELKVICAS